MVVCWKSCIIGLADSRCRALGNQLDYTTHTVYRCRGRGEGDGGRDAVICIERESTCPYRAVYDYNTPPWDQRVSHILCVVHSNRHIARRIWTVAGRLYTPWVKKQDTKLLAITSTIIIRFSKFFTIRLCSKFANCNRGSIAKNLRCDELLYYTFIINSAGERIFKIGEHLAKLRAKSLAVSYTPFALHFCPQRWRSRQISWITCVLQTETVFKRCCVNRQISLS